MLLFLTFSITVRSSSYCMTDCNSPLRQPSLYEQVCCCPCNIGKNFKLKEDKITEIVMCPPNIPDSCPYEGNVYISVAICIIYWYYQMNVDLECCKTDCKEWFMNGNTTSGVYTINPDEATPFEVSVSIIILTI